MIMTLFNEREAAFETAFAHDEELLFRAKAHRTEAIARWVGRRIGKAGASLAAYADQMQGLAVREGDEQLLQQLHGDLGIAGAGVPLPMLQHKMDALLADAVLELKKG
jgi:hypothetical protein